MFREKINIGSGLDKIEGIITLELNNAKTGKLEQKITSKNFIAPPALRRHQWAQRNYFKNGIYTLQNDRDGDYQPASMFDTLYLSSSTQAEDPGNEYIVPGQIIGYATKSTYSGTSIYRGSPNGTASEGTTTYTKWVFNWPAIAANGTIGSVGWMGGLAHDSYTALSPLNGTATVADTWNTPGTWGYFAQAGTNQAFGVGAGSTGAADAGTTISVLNNEYALASTFVVSGNFTHVRGLAWDGANSRLWVIGRNNTNYFIAAYNASGTNTVTPVAIASRDYRTLAFDGTNLWSAVQSGNTVTMYRINPSDGNDVSNFSYTLSPAANTADLHAGLCWHPDRQQLWVRINTRRVTSNSANWHFPNGRLIGFDTAGNVTTGAVGLEAWLPAYTGTRVVRVGPQYYLTDFDYYDRDHFSLPSASTYASSTNVVTLLHPDSLGSRSLLPSTITKTDQQTLTVTYQINYPYPGSY